MSLEQVAFQLTHGSMASCAVSARHTEHSSRHVANWEHATGGKWMGMERVGLIGVELMFLLTLDMARLLFLPTFFIVVKVLSYVNLYGLLRIHTLI